MRLLFKPIFFFLFPQTFKIFCTRWRWKHLSSGENNIFFTISCHRQTYQNCQQLHQRSHTFDFISYFSLLKISESFLIFFLVEHYIRHGLEDKHLLLKFFEIFNGNLFYMDLPKRFKQLLQPYWKNSTIELYLVFDINSPIYFHQSTNNLVLWLF